MNVPTDLGAERLSCTHCNAGGGDAGAEIAPPVSRP
jgi:hypothetical protein